MLKGSGLVTGKMKPLEHGPIPELLTKEQPLVICRDVYEHAFYVDYQNRKQQYVDKFVQFVDWHEVNQRLNFLRG